MSVRAGRCAVLAPGDEPMRAPGPKRVRSDVGARRFLRRSVENGSGPLPPRAYPARAPRQHPNMAAAFIARGFAITASLAGARTSARRAPDVASARGVVFHANRRRVPVASAGARAHRAFAASADADRIAELVEKKIAENKVMVWSKSYCPFCSRVKTLLDDAGVPYEVVELDRLHEEAEIQDALAGMTGQRTVPNVFIGGAHVGGCDDTFALRDSGKLDALLEAAGAK